MGPPGPPDPPERPVRADRHGPAGAAGLRVVVVRSERRAGSLADRLDAAGFVVVRCPLVAIEPLGDAPVGLAGYDWLVVTSPNAADELARRGVHGWPSAIAAIGPGTAERLAAMGLPAGVVPHVFTQEGLLDVLPKPVGRVLIAGAEDARPLLADELGAESLALYRTVELEPAEPPEADLAALAASSQARAFGKLGTAIPVVSIGPQTTEAARAAGLRVLAEADPHDLDGLVAAVQRAAAAL